MRLHHLIYAALAVFGVGAGRANAGVHDLRLAVVAHNLGDRHHREESENYEAEVVWETSGFLEFLGKPRPYMMVSVNDKQFTSFAGVGLYWRKPLSEHWTFEPGFGYVIHDGKIDTPTLDDERVQLGSRDLFRTTLALEREFGDHLAAQAYFEHLSHGQILGQGRNQGLNEAGIRRVFRIKPE